MSAWVRRAWNRRDFEAMTTVDLTSLPQIRARLVGYNEFAAEHASIEGLESTKYEVAALFLAGLGSSRSSMEHA